MREEPLVGFFQPGTQGSARGPAQRLQAAYRPVEAGGGMSGPLGAPLLADEGAQMQVVTVARPLA